MDEKKIDNIIMIVSAIKCVGVGGSGYTCVYEAYAGGINLLLQSITVIIYNSECKCFS